MKKLKLSYLIAIFFIGLLAACQKNNIGDIEPKNTEPLPSKVISIEDALNELDLLLSEMNGGRKSTYKISEISVVGAKTFENGRKSSIPNHFPDTLLYVLNFGQEDGYAVLSANTKINTPVLCVTELGTLNEKKLSDAMDYIEQANQTKSSFSVEDEEFVSMGERFVPVAIMAYTNRLINSGINVGGGGFPVNPIVYQTIVKIGPHLKTKWAQKYPYNMFEPNGYPAGCVAVAAAQVVALHEPNHRYNWALLKTVGSTVSETFETMDAYQCVSNFMQDIGSYDNCRIRYGKDGSWGLADGAKRTFNNFGFRNVKKHLGMAKADRARIDSHLTKGGVVFMTGANNLNGGHAWVIDGIWIRNKINTLTSALIERQELYHINWGWGGYSNGYFVQGVFYVPTRVDKEQGDGGESDIADDYGWTYRTIVYDL